MLTYELKKQPGMPLYESLYRCIRGDILSGALKPNETLANADIIEDGIVSVSHTITRDAMETLEKVGDEEKPISIAFRAYVVQSSGFASAQAAWNSLAGKGGIV